VIPDYLLDLNVILDYFQDRLPHAQHAEALFLAEQSGRVRLWVSGDALSTLFYLLEREFRQRRQPAPSALAQSKLQGLLKRVRVAPITGPVLDAAFGFGMEDFEDAIQAAAAMEAGVRTMVTRDASGYRDLPADAMAVLTPAQGLALL